MLKKNLSGRIYKWHFIKNGKVHIYEEEGGLLSVLYGMSQSEVADVNITFHVQFLFEIANFKITGQNLINI